MENIPVVTKCNTCKAAFSSVELVREHYKTDWHVFNSKRRSNNLNHVTLEEYRKQFPVKKQNNSSKAPTTSSRERNTSHETKQNISTSRTSLGTSSSASLKPSASVRETSISEDLKTENISEITEERKDDVVSQSLKDLALQLGVETERIETIVATALTNTLEDDVEEKEDQEVEQDDNDPILIEPNVSIFDDKEFRTVEACVDYMEKTFGFFIPEREYLVDLPGLLVYLGEKVKIGGICLYCQKQFTPGRPCQNHMMSKSHCKIAYQEGVDEDEFEDFYDFSSSYGQNGRNNEEDGEDLVDETLEISPIGELILTDGRTVGHRAFRKYYRQKHKPMDNRLSVTAQRREEAHKFQSTFRSTDFASLAPGALNGMDLRRLSDTEIMSLLIQKHKEMRRIQQMEQRLQRRQEYRHHRAEYMSVKDQLRARINRTDKIRDYHGMLM